MPLAGGTGAGVLGRGGGGPLGRSGGDNEFKLDSLLLTGNNPPLAPAADSPS